MALCADGHATAAVEGLKFSQLISSVCYDGKSFAEMSLQFDLLGIPSIHPFYAA